MLSGTQGLGGERLVPGVRVAKSLQLCPALCNPMDHSPPGFSVHGDSLGRTTWEGCHALLQGIFPTQGWDPGLVWLLHCRQMLYLSAARGAPSSWRAAPSGFLEAGTFEMGPEEQVGFGKRGFEKGVLGKRHRGSQGLEAGKSPR